VRLLAVFLGMGVCVAKHTFAHFPRHDVRSNEQLIIDVCFTDAQPISPSGQGRAARPPARASVSSGPKPSSTVSQPTAATAASGETDAALATRLAGALADYRAGLASASPAASRLVVAPLVLTDGYGIPAHPAFAPTPSAPCESGVIASLLRAAGLPVSEALCFGLSAALSFCYFPPARINGLPLLSYRMFPNWIFNQLRKRLRLPLRAERFRDPEAGRRRLDELLAAAALLALAGAGAVTARAAPLANADIVKMAAAGLDETLIITAIENAADNKFDAGPDALVALAQASVPKPVIAALIKRAATTAAATTTPAPPPPPASVPPPPASAAPARLPPPTAAAGARGSHVVAYDTALPDATIRNLIRAAARSRGWDIVSDAPGTVGLDYKGYAATVGYGAGSIVITDHGGHAKTPGWARALRAAIQKELEKLADASVPAAGAGKK
jgi:hypothetical protein